MAHVISLGVGLYFLWVLLSGFFEPFLLSLGLLSCILVVLIALRMDVIDHESYPLHILPRLPFYVPWLLWEIVKANVSVAKLILHPKLPISPTVLHVRASQTTSTGRVMYANSITLTPGTVSMNLDEDQIQVHALTAGLAQDLQAGDMDRQVRRLEGGD